MIGQTLGHYRIGSKLGEGGMGVVYKARDTHLNLAVAIKVLRADAVAIPARERRFVQEAKAASALNHPNILHVYDIDRANGANATLAMAPPRSGHRRASGPARRRRRWCGDWSRERALRADPAQRQPLPSQ
jgi:protein kinase-like protein